MNEQEDQQAQGSQALNADPRCKAAVDAAVNTLVASVMRSGGRVPTANDLAPLFARLWCLGYQDCIADEAKRNHEAWMRSIQAISEAFEEVITEHGPELRPVNGSGRPIFPVDTSQPILSVEEWNLLRRRSTQIGTDSSA